MKTLTKTQSITTTKLLIATAVLPIGGGAAALATLPSTDGSKQGTRIGSNISKVVSCQQLNDGIFITRSLSTPGYKLPNGCRNAGHSMREYTMTCMSSTTYKTSWVQPCPPVATCTDSDGGKNYSMQGTITVTNGPDYGYSATDSCISDNQFTENYCENNVGKTETVTCPFSCKNGACSTTPVVSTSTISVSWSQDTPSGASSPSLEQVVAKFVFTSFPNQLNDATIKSLAIKTFATFPVSGWKLYRDYLNQPAIAIGHLSSSSTEKIVFDNFETIIASGSSKIFYVTANTTQAVTNSSLSLTIHSGIDIGTDAIIKSSFPLISKTFTY